MIKVQHFWTIWFSNLPAGLVFRKDGFLRPWAKSLNRRNRLRVIAGAKNCHIAIRILGSAWPARPVQAQHKGPGK